MEAEKLLKVLPDILREAAEIIDGSKEPRFPIVDELQGFAGLIEECLAKKGGV